jgi:hypothetical protein
MNVLRTNWRCALCIAALGAMACGEDDAAAGDPGSMRDVQIRLPTTMPGVGVTPGTAGTGGPSATTGTSAGAVPIVPPPPAAPPGSGQAGLPPGAPGAAPPGAAPGVAGAAAPAAPVKPPIDAKCNPADRSPIR